jgi:hypothetical protein
MIEKIKKWNFLKQCHDESGIVFVMLAICLFVLLGFAALAIDVGHVMVVRNELQNAADATALTAASRLFPHTPVSEPTFPPPNWTAADTEAAAAIPLNKSDKLALTSCQTECGYWDVNTHEPSSYWGPCTAMPPPPSSIPVNWAPGIRVVVTRASSSEDNGGPVRHFFARVLGIITSDVGARATAVLYSPGMLRSDSVLPVAISKDAYEAHVDENPVSICDPYASTWSGCTDPALGQWTNFWLDRSDASTMRELLVAGTDGGLTLDKTSIWIFTGVTNTIYASGPRGENVQDLYAGQDVYLPVVDPLVVGTSSQVVAVVGFHVDQAIGGSSKVIIGHFTGYYDGTGPIGPNWGPMDFARLVQ